MYRINLLPRKVLITPDEVVKWGPVDESPGEKNILTAIQIAEDRFVKQAICSDLYNDFRDKKNVIVTDINKDYLENLVGNNVVLAVGDCVNAIEFCDANYANLWNEHLWKLVAECVIYVATPTNWSRHTAAGEMMNSPKSIAADSGSGANSIDLAEIKWKMSRIQQDRIDPLIAATQEYLQSYRGNFPKFNCHQFTDYSGCGSDINGNKTGVSYKRKTPWIHGVYDRRNDCCDNDKY